MNSESFTVDVCPCGGVESSSGYPKQAADQMRAHLLAEEAVAELHATASPGEYLVAVLQQNETIATQIVVVPAAGNTA